MVLRAVVGLLMVLSQAAFAHDTSGGIPQCSGVIPGAKPFYFFSKQGDRIVVRSSYSEANSFGIGKADQSIVSSKVNVQIFPASNSSVNTKVLVKLTTSSSAEDCKSKSYSGVRQYGIQLKPCALGNTLGFEGNIGGAAYVGGRPENFPEDSKEAIAIGYMGYCKGRAPTWGGTSHKIEMNINGRIPKNPVGEEDAFGLTL